jgi:hypothetical protein
MSGTPVAGGAACLVHRKVPPWQGVGKRTPQGTALAGGVEKGLEILWHPPSQGDAKGLEILSLIGYHVLVPDACMFRHCGV